MVKSPINTQILKTVMIKVKRTVNKPVIRPDNTITQPDKFIPQVYRKDVLANMLSHTELGGEKLFRKLITDNKVAENHDERNKIRQGWIFETICQIAMTMKLVEKLDYTEIYEGKADYLKAINSFKPFLKLKVNGGGDNLLDFVLKQTDTFIPFSVKYMAKYEDTDVDRIANTFNSRYPKHKVGLFVKDRKFVTDHKFHDELSDKSIFLRKCDTDGLLFDERDIVKSLQMFCDKYKNKIFRNIDDFVEHIDETYLLTTRKQLILRTHQKITIKRFENDIYKNENKMFCIAHKPRSGKSITMLSICDSLLESGRKRILMMTSVPATIKSFTDDLDKFIAFRNIKYKTQDEFDTIDDNFVGVVLCSTQFLKTKSKTTDKKELVKMMDFDVIITDESHFGSSTEKTKTEIIDEDVVDAIMKNKVTIFASGTPDKTKKFYGIKSSYVYEWETTDESYMKKLFIEPRNEFALEYMSRRHGPMFLECYNDVTLDRNYQRCPTQVLLKHSISDKLIKEINDYNIENNTKYGYSCSSLFELTKVIDKNHKSGYKYEEKFAITQTTNGKKILLSFFDSIISTSRSRTDTIINQIETIQATRKSRTATNDTIGTTECKPSLIIIYLPTHTGNSNISMLQQTMKEFLKIHNLWVNYNIEYSNATQDSVPGLDNRTTCKEYNNYIEIIMKKAKEQNKMGCVLLLGNKGGVGITYKDCDVTISLDDGHNLDQQKQRYSRALTEGDGKTIGINIDMNIQRTYSMLSDIVRTHRKNTKTTMTNAEILYYLHKENIFTFDPQHINNGIMREADILSYYDKVSQEMIQANNDSSLLERIKCDDDEMHEYINIECFKSDSLALAVNPDLEGEQQDCPKGDKIKIRIDAPTNSTIAPVTVAPDTQNQVVEEKKKEVINKTLALCKTFLFPLLAVISRTTGIKCFKEILICEKTTLLLQNLLIDKKIDLENDNYRTIVQIMNVIIDKNLQIVNDITEIYSHAAPHELRGLIEKHFIPTNEEKKNNAEIPTPVALVDEMLNVIPEEFWTTPKKVFEPCCGKGNFVLGIFDKFYKGLKEHEPNDVKRCEVIMTQCLYYADLTTMNVFITTEILKCHIQSYTGQEELDYTFNSYTGDTLDTKAKKSFKIEKFDAVIGNPPYSTDPSKPDSKSLYDKFTEQYIDDEKLLFVVPSRWFVGGKGLEKFRKMMMERKDIVLINHDDDSKKWFGNKIVIEGGVNYFLKDSGHNGNCVFNEKIYDLSKYDCVIKPEFHKIIDIVKQTDSIDKVYRSSGLYKYRTNDKRYKDEGNIKCFVSVKQSKDRCKYIDEYIFNEKNTFWKVITARANGKSPRFGAMFIGKPDEIYTDSYISFRVENEEEAKSLMSYLQTKIVNHLLSIRKISQDISENTCKWIPLVPLDRIWTDDLVCEYLKIDKNLYM